MAEPKNYDVIVIGGGGGNKISSPAAMLGKKVAVIEKDRMGGTCLNRGCIPSKMLIHPANVMTSIKEAGKFGITGQENLQNNFAELVKRVSETVDKDSDGIVTSYTDNNNIDLYQGAAKFVSDKVVEVNGQQLTAEKIFIATGARPSVPPIAGLAGTPFMTSTEALRRESLPSKLIVIGGGYIGCELGHVYNAFGAETVFFVRGRYLDREDTEIKEAFQENFDKKHTTHYGKSEMTVSFENNQFTVRAVYDGGRVVEETAEALLVATGVVPNTDELGLENTGVTTNDHGYIEVDEFLQTKVPGIYALGDCVGNYMFRHSVNFEGEYLLENLFLKPQAEPIAYPPMPHAVFTHPEIGGVGKTEDELKEEGVDYLAVRHDYEKSAQGMARLPDVGFVKLIFERSSKKLVGAHIIGEESATMVHQLISAMTMGATSTDLLNMIYIHPALPEVVRNAARKAEAELS